MHDHTDTTTSSNGDGRARSERQRRSDVGTRLSEAAARLGAIVEDLVRRGNRRRVTLRGRTGVTWLRLPLTLAVAIAIVASIAWLPLVVLALIVLFALRVEITVDRAVAATADARSAGRDTTGSTT